jgi:hypothetical protein
MPRFDRNQSSLVEKVVREKTKNPKIGTVKKVFEHTKSDDDSNFEIDVTVDGETNKLTRVPVHAPGSDSIVPPKYGDKIIIIFTEGEVFNPVAIGTGWSNKDRPPLGKAGMYRNRFESDTSPAGDGDLHITGYTKYDDNPATNNKKNLTPEESFVQITKHAEGDNYDPSNSDSLPAKIEMYDSPKDGEAWIEMKMNKVGGGDSSVPWGMKFNIKTGEWKIVGPNGFGIKADGQGNFVWDHSNITFNEVASGGLSL